MGLWGLPAPILNIVSLHHRSRVQDEGRMTPLIAVHAADVLCGSHDRGSVFEMGRLDQVALERVGVWERREAWAGLLAQHEDHA